MVTELYDHLNGHQDATTDDMYDELKSFITLQKSLGPVMKCWLWDRDFVEQIDLRGF